MPNSKAKRNRAKTRMMPSSIRRSRRQRVPRERGALGFAIVLAAVLALALLTRIYLERRTQQAGIAWEQRHRELQVVVRERENLKMERETYRTGDYITARATELQLQLPLPGQVRRMRRPEPIELGRAASSLNPNASAEAVADRR